MAVDVDASHHYLLLFGDDTCDVVHDANVIVADNLERCGVLCSVLSAPFRLYDSITEALAQFRCVRTVAAVNLDSTVYSNETEHLVTVYRPAAIGQLVIDAFQIAVDYEHVTAAVGKFLGWILVVVFVGAPYWLLRGQEIVVVGLYFLVFLYHVVDVERFVGNPLVEIVRLFDSL